jgi:hypothetical protein
LRFNDLVCGEQDDASAMAFGSANQGESSEDVVCNCGERLMLEQRNVLECGCVKDQLRRVRGEHFVEQGAVGDAAQQGSHDGGQAALEPILLQAVEAAL